MATDEQLIEVFEIFGSSYFSLGSDSQLKHWGHSDDDIKQIKKTRVLNMLEICDNQIRLYKTLNKICGGVNAV